jgi:hypothetical protein
MSHQLSSCPFCGTLEVTLDGKSEHCRVRCMRCGTEGSYVYFDGKDDDDIDRAERDAVRRWNERASAAPPPADDAVSEAMVEAALLAFGARHMHGDERARYVGAMRLAIAAALAARGD